MPNFKVNKKLSNMTNTFSLLSKVSESRYDPIESPSLIDQTPIPLPTPVTPIFYPKMTTPKKHIQTFRATISPKQMLL